jgi:hypothetical protein
LAGEGGATGKRRAVAGYDDAEIREVAERAFPELVGRSQEDLRAQVGAFAVEGASFLAAPSREHLVLGGDVFIAERRDPLAAAVCEAYREGRVEDEVSATALAGVLEATLPALGIAPPAAIPLGVMALGVHLLKVGLEEWCRAHGPETEASRAQA